MLLKEEERVLEYNTMNFKRKEIKKKLIRQRKRAFARN